MTQHDQDGPTLEAIRATGVRIKEHVVETPVREWTEPELAAGGTRIWLKEELFQRTGTFKPRGALAVMLELSSEGLARGVTAVSAGNHAMAVAYAAATLGTTAKVVMPRSASSMRVEKCRAYGAEVVLVDDVHAAFREVKRIEAEEGRTFVHPFEGPQTALGTATVGLELMEQTGGELDAVVVPIGGGGLCAGVAAAVKLHTAGDVAVYGVEPEGADTMHRSFKVGSPQAIDEVRTIADSLGAPHAAPYSFRLCRRYVDELVMIDDDRDPEGHVPPLPLGQAGRGAGRSCRHGGPPGTPWRAAARQAGGARRLRSEHRRPHVLTAPGRPSGAPRAGVARLTSLSRPAGQGGRGPRAGPPPGCCRPGS
jgi:threonine dehydratase